MNVDILIYNHAQDRWKFMRNPNLFFSSGRTVPVKAEDALSQAGRWIMHPRGELSCSLSDHRRWGGANTGQHLQHKLGNTEQPASKPISALKPDVSQLTSRPVRIHLKPSKRLICWKPLIFVRPAKKKNFQFLTCVQTLRAFWSLSLLSSFPVHSSISMERRWQGFRTAGLCVCVFSGSRRQLKRKMYSRAVQWVNACVFCALGRLNPFYLQPYRFHLQNPLRML